MADVDERALAPDSYQESSHFFQRLLRGGQADALNRTCQRLQAFERQRQMGAALVAGEGMNLVDNHRLDRSEHLTSAGAGEQDVERLGSCDENVRRLAKHGRPVALRRIAGADQHAYLREVAIELGQFAERALQVLLHVVAQRPQGRDVEHGRFVGRRRP